MCKCSLFLRSPSGTVIKEFARLPRARATALGMQVTPDAGASAYACGLARLCAAHSTSRPGSPEPLPALLGFQATHALDRQRVQPLRSHANRRSAQLCLGFSWQ